MTRRLIVFGSRISSKNAKNRWPLAQINQCRAATFSEESQQLLINTETDLDFFLRPVKWMRFDVSILIFAASKLIDGEHQFIGVSPMASHSINLLWNQIEGRFFGFAARIPEEIQSKLKCRRSHGGSIWLLPRVDVICIVAAGSWQKAFRLPLKSCLYIYLRRRDLIEASTIKAANSLNHWESLIYAWEFYEGRCACDGLRSFGWLRPETA